MAFTSLTIVRKHLLAAGTPALAVERVPVTLAGTDPVPLPHRNLVDKSSVIKWCSQITPELEGPALLSYPDWTDLRAGQLVPDSTVVTPGECLLTVYTEEVDYQVDEPGGRIRCTADSTIPPLQAVYIYVRRYALFTETDDFTVDCGAGTLARTPDSRIPDGATVLVDYTIAAGSVEDELIEQALLEAHDRIVRALAPEYNGSSPDQGLQTGETLLVLAILARALALQTLDARPGSDGPARAREWQNLAALCETQAWQTLRPFLDPYALHGPEKRSNE